MYSIHWFGMWETSSILRHLPWNLDVQRYLFSFLSVDDLLKLKKVSIHLMKCVRIYELIVSYHQDPRGHTPSQRVIVQRQHLLPYINPSLSMRIHFGNSHLLLARTNHSILARGNNYYGQLGDHTRSIQFPGAKHPFTRVRIQHEDPYVHSVHGGVDASFVLTCSGNILTWGRNTKGILGHGHNKMVLAPTLISPSVHHKVPICKLDVNTNNAIAITPCGQVYTWGDYANFQPHTHSIINRGTFSTTNQPTLQKALCFTGAYKFVDVSAGQGFFLALTQDRYHVLTWGHACCYNESERKDQSIGVTRVKGLRLGSGRRIHSIDAGMEHAVVTISVGQVYSWGNHEQGVLGRRQNADAYVPQSIHPKAFDYRKVVKVTAGNSHTLFLDEEGYGYFAGCLPSSIEKRFHPQKIARDLIDIRSSSYHSILINKNKRVYVFGDNEYGEIGANLQSIIRHPVILR